MTQIGSNWRRTLARALSTVENRSPGWRDIVRQSYGARGQARVIGVTGPPGAGKSSLIDTLAADWAAQGHRVGIIAIDPASPFSGGAVLGDRIRMRRSADDERVFIRSMSARGHGGGLNEAALDICAVLAGSGITRILLETVGVGQNEVEVAFVADCTLVLSVPGLGDAVQAAKAGLLEVGDVYVVNKGDLAGAANVERDIRIMLSLVFPGDQGENPQEAGKSMDRTANAAAGRVLRERFGLGADSATFWHPPVVTVSAASGTGMDELTRAIERFLEWLDDSGHGEIRRNGRIDRQLRSLLTRLLLERLLANIEPSDKVSGWSARIAAGDVDPHTAAEHLVAQGESS